MTSTATATATATAWRVQDEESKSPLEAVKAARQSIGGARCQLRNSRTLESPSGAKILALRNHQIFRSNVHTFPTFVRVYLSRSPMELVGYRYPTEAAKLETKALKAKRPGFTDERYNETSYYVENGLRKVYPYYFTFTTFTKGRWVGEKILEVFAREFRAHPAEEYERCIRAGTLTVNYQRVDVDYRLRHNDLLANIVHR
uniref:Uncharacterized protein n=1 Tax=Vespula pensylvanica TaxID=30213 RepID=A0A834NK52_VESPE|nr:hypothetical protein H0235_012981 [Vespula pensylvanica]